MSRRATLSSPVCVFLGPEKSLPCSFLNWSLIFQRASTCPSIITMMITDSRDVGRASRTGCLGALQATGKHPHVAHSGEELTCPRFKLAANAFSRAFRPGFLGALRQGKPSQDASESQLEPHARCELSDRDLRWSVTGSTPLVRTSGSCCRPTMRFLLFRCAFTIAMPRRLSPSHSRLCRASGPAAGLSLPLRLPALFLSPGCSFSLSSTLKTQYFEVLNTP